MSKLAFTCLCSFSRQSSVNFVTESKTIYALDMNYVLDQMEQTCVCAALADTFEILMLFEMLPKHTIFTPAQ